MIKPIYGAENTWKFVQALFGVVIAIALACLSISTFQENRSDFETLFTANIIPLIFSVGLLLAIFDYVRCIIKRKIRIYMKAIGDEGSIKELKKELAGESFKKMKFPEEVIVRLKNQPILNKRNQVMVSKNWVYAMGTYIPKEKILGITTEIRENFHELLFELQDGTTTSMGYYDKRSAHDIVLYLRAGSEIPNI